MVIIEAAKESHIYAGLRSDTTSGSLRQSIDDATIANHLVPIAPKASDAVFIPAGAVHTLSGDVVVFEVQQNSGVTFRLKSLPYRRQESALDAHRYGALALKALRVCPEA